MLTIPSHHTLSNITNKFNIKNDIQEPNRLHSTRNKLLNPIFLLCIQSSVLEIDRNTSDYEDCLVSIKIPFC